MSLSNMECDDHKTRRRSLRLVLKNAMKRLTRPNKRDIATSKRTKEKMDLVLLQWLHLHRGVVLIMQLGNTNFE
jgi:hypothetical protein